MYIPVAPAGNSSGMGFGGDWAWILLLLVLFGGIGNGFGGGWNGNDLYPWMNQNNQISNGFRDQALGTQINGISSQLYTNQIADMERSFNAQTATTAGLSGIQAQLAQCCCDNRAATADLKYTIATENCADRAAVSNALRDVLTANNAATQKILDQLCADKLEAKNDLIAQLRSELMYARGQASQDVQTAAIQAGQRALANEVEQYVLPTPRPAYIVSNPNCCQQQVYGCGVG